MASKIVFIVLACFLLINTKVSSAKEEDILTESPNLIAIATPPPPSPSPPTIKAPPPPPPHSPIPTPAPPPPPPPAVKPPRNKKECYPLCVVRCGKHSRKNMCLRGCMTCCDRCKCVPPGQYGNKEMCGKCYAGMTTRGGKLKCP